MTVMLFYLCQALFRFEWAIQNLDTSDLLDYRPIRNRTILYIRRGITYRTITLTNNWARYYFFRD